MLKKQGKVVKKKRTERERLEADPKVLNERDACSAPTYSFYL